MRSASAWRSPPSAPPTRRVDDQRTFGLYRLEILAALANAVLLFAVAGYVLVEAVQRLGDPPPAVPSLPVLLIGLLGLAVNGSRLLLLRSGADVSLNVAAPTSRSWRTPSVRLPWLWPPS